MINLNGKQIRELAEFAGFSIVEHDYQDENETEYTIALCPKDGVLNDDETVSHYEYVVYLSEYPEEGVMPLGDEIQLGDNK